MKHKFSEIELAFEYVSSQPPFTNTAMFSIETGRIYYLSELGDSDEDAPDDVLESDEYIEIPHKKELDLGIRLVRRFIRERAPEIGEEVEAIFSRQGAYSRFKGLLQGRNLLEAWYEYEAQRTSAALHDWCKQNNIDLIDQFPADRV